MSVPEATVAAEALVFDTEFLRKLERIEIVARKIFRGQLRGEHTTMRRGRGLELADFRSYQPGDDLRYVDWNIFSRLDRLFLKLYVSEEDVTLNLLVDASASMRFGTPSKFDQARRMAAAIAYVGLCNLDRVSVSVFADGLGLGMPGLRTKHAMTKILRFLESIEARDATNLTAAGRAFAARARHPGLVMVITDLLDWDDARPGLEALVHRGNEVVVVQLLAEEEIAPPLDGPLRLRDSETGEELRVTVDAELRHLYRRRLDAHLARIEAFCREHAVEYLRASTAIPFEDVVLRYLRRGMHVR
ncbi:MAG: DUF58 domain-containing protein [Ectothiorhodospiraceae bacterium]|nr:DUF58 domain-containing protein [Ectothiorhodospiraceae bacterium]